MRAELHTNPRLGAVEGARVYRTAAAQLSRAGVAVKHLGGNRMIVDVDAAADVWDEIPVGLLIRSATRDAADDRPAPPEPEPEPTAPTIEPEAEPTISDVPEPTIELYPPDELDPGEAPSEPKRPTRKRAKQED